MTAAVGAVMLVASTPVRASRRRLTEFGDESESAQQLTGGVYQTNGTSRVRTFCV